MVKLLRGGVGHDHFPRFGRVTDPRGDVDVDTEIVAAEPARPTHVDSGPHARAVPIHLYLVESILGRERRFDRRLGVEESRHQAVA